MTVFQFVVAVLLGIVLTLIANELVAGWRDRRDVRLLEREVADAEVEAERHAHPHQGHVLVLRRFRNEDDVA